VLSGMPMTFPIPSLRNESLSETLRIMSSGPVLSSYLPELSALLIPVHPYARFMRANFMSTRFTSAKVHEYKVHECKDLRKESRH
jgi:hypothetical protein